MLAGFEGAVNAQGGTATPSFAGFPFSKLSLAGKTGTASGAETVPTGWFVGWGPVNDPQYLIVVVIEKGGYGASAAAPVARDGFQYLVNNPPVPVVLSAPVASGATSTTSTTPGTRTTPTTAPAH
jgi:cell division protein FtsI/penicillin-binding protein 2